LLAYTSLKVTKIIKQHSKTKNDCSKNTLTIVPIDDVNCPIAKRLEIRKAIIKNKKAETLKFLSAVLCFTMVTLCVIFLINSPIYIFLPATFVFMALGIACAFTDNKKREALFKLFFLALIALSVVFVFYVALSRTGILERLNNAEEVSSFIKDLGFIGIFVFIILN